MKWYETDLEIRYADTDQMGVVHHGVYPIYCEISRTHICAELGLPYHRMEAAGYWMMVVDMYCRYKAPARYGDPIYARGAVARLTKKLIEFHYEIRQRGTEKLLYTGYSKHLVTDRQARPTSMPAEFLEILGRALDHGV